MLPNEPDERLIYLACRQIFYGSYSAVRKRKQVMSLIQRNQPALTDILREYNIDRTCNVIQRLLKAQVFESAASAKIRFPELFDVSPAQSADREASEAEAARDEANAVREISETEIPKDSRPDSQNRLAAEVTKGSDANETRRKSIPSLYPMYIHYRSQHLITTNIQKLVEEACFAYTQEKLPQLLVKKGWDCPEAVELTEWVKLLRQHAGDQIEKPNEVFELLCELRHTAVHRLQKTARGVQRLAENAQRFLEALEDTHRSGMVSHIRRELNLVIEEVRHNKDLLEGRYLAELQEIGAKRAALETRERDAKQAMVDSDAQCLNEANQRIERVFQHLDSYRYIGDEAAGEMPIEQHTATSDTEEEFLEAVLDATCSS